MYVNPFERMKKKHEDEEKKRGEIELEKAKYARLGAQMGLNNDQLSASNFIKNIMRTESIPEEVPFSVSIDRNKNRIQNPSLPRQVRASELSEQMHDLGNQFKSSVINNGNYGNDQNYFEHQPNQSGNEYDENYPQENYRSYSWRSQKAKNFSHDERYYAPKNTQNFNRQEERSYLKPENGAQNYFVNQKPNEYINEQTAPRSRPERAVPDYFLSDNQQNNTVSSQSRPYLKPENGAQNYFVNKKQKEVIEEQTMPRSRSEKAVPEYFLSDEQQKINNSQPKPFLKPETGFKLKGNASSQANLEDQFKGNPLNRNVFPWQQTEPSENYKRILKEQEKEKLLQEAQDKELDKFFLIEDKEFLKSKLISPNEYVELEANGELEGRNVLIIEHPELINKNNLVNLIDVDLNKVVLYSSPCLFLLKKFIKNLPRLISIEDRRTLWERTSLFLAATDWGKTGSEVDYILEGLNLASDPFGMFINEFTDLFNSYNFTESINLVLSNSKDLELSQILLLNEFISNLLMQVPGVSCKLNIGFDIVDFELMSEIFANYDYVVSDENLFTEEEFQPNFENNSGRNRNYGPQNNFAGPYDKGPDFLNHTENRFTGVLETGTNKNNYQSVNSEKQFIKQNENLNSNNHSNSFGGDRFLSEKQNNKFTNEEFGPQKEKNGSKLINVKPISIEKHLSNERNKTQSQKLISVPGHWNKLQN